VEDMTDYERTESGKPLRFFHAELGCDTALLIKFNVSARLLCIIVSGFLKETMKKKGTHDHSNKRDVHEQVRVRGG
jgi:hypothetical protein